MQLTSMRIELGYTVSTVSYHSFAAGKRMQMLCFTKTTRNEKSICVIRCGDKAASRVRSWLLSGINTLRVDGRRVASIDLVYRYGSNPIWTNYTLIN